MRIKKMQFNILDNLNIEIPALSEDAEGKLKGGFCSVKTFGLEAERSGMGSGCIGGRCPGINCTGGNCTGQGCVGNQCTGDNCVGDQCVGTNCTGNQCAGENPTDPTDPTDEKSSKSLFGMSLVF